MKSWIPAGVVGAVALVSVAAFLVYNAGPDRSSGGSISNDLDLVSYGIAVDVYHDHARKVTCWRHSQAIACIPDWQLSPPDGGSR